MEEKKLISTGAIFFDLILTLIFGVFMTWVCSHHAPGASLQLTKWIVGAFAAIPVTGTFWLALCLARITIVDMFRRRAVGKDF